MNRALNANIKTSWTSPLDLHITARRRLLTAKENIFGIIGKNDPDLLRIFIEQHPASVTDTLYNGGRDALACCIETPRYSVDLVRVLFQEGADVNSQDDVGRTALEKMQTRILLGTLPPEAEQSLRAFIPLPSDIIDNYEFSLLHKVVLNICHVEITPDAFSREDADRVDAHMRTPLHWAVSRGDDQTVHKLLQLGADINTQALNGATPISNAISFKSYACFDMLLDLGADLTIRTNQGYCLLHLAVWQNDLYITQKLLSKGVQVDTKRLGRGSTSLHIAAMRDHADICRTLLEYGAHINEPNIGKNTPLHKSITYNAHQSTRLLISKKANLGCIDDKGFSILHKAAQFGDLETLDLLSSCRPHGLDPNLQDNNGHTASQLFSARKGKSQDLEEAFQRLILSVEHTDPVAEESEDEGTIFYDAEE